MGANQRNRERECVAVCPMTYIPEKVERLQSSSIWGLFVWPAGLPKRKRMQTNPSCLDVCPHHPRVVWRNSRWHCSMAGNRSGVISTGLAPPAENNKLYSCSDWGSRFWKEYGALLVFQCFPILQQSACTSNISRRHDFWYHHCSLNMRQTLTSRKILGMWMRLIEKRSASYFQWCWVYIFPQKNGNKKSPEQWTKTQRTSHCELHYTTASLCQKLSNNIIESSMPMMPIPILTAPGSGKSRSRRGQYLLCATKMPMKQLTTWAKAQDLSHWGHTFQLRAAWWSRTTHQLLAGPVRLVAQISWGMLRCVRFPMGCRFSHLDVCFLEVQFHVGRFFS